MMSSSLISKSTTFCVRILCLIIAFSGCGGTNKKSNNNSSKPTAASSPTPVLQNDSINNNGPTVPTAAELKEIKARHIDVKEARCKNPVVTDDVPTTWISVKDSELMTNGNGHYVLTEVILHSEIYRDGNNPPSATTKVVISGRKNGHEDVARQIICRDLGGMDKMSFETNPIDSINPIDGSYTERRNIKFELSIVKNDEFFDKFSVNEPDKFGQHSEQHDKEVEDRRREDLRSDKDATIISTYTKFYKISSEEFEIRSTQTSVAKEYGANATLETNVSYHYVLNKN